MRKALSLLVSILILGGVCHALSSTQPVTFSVSVSSVFELSVDPGVVDFGKVNPGEIKRNIPSEGVVVTAKTNNGSPWYLKINDVSQFSSGSGVIPNSNFYWTGWSDGTGKWHGTGNKAMSTTPTLIYNSGNAEVNNLPGGTAAHLKFQLSVPEKQSPGLYTTTVKFTMTE